MRMLQRHEIRTLLAVPAAALGRLRLTRADWQAPLLVTALFRLLYSGWAAFFLLVSEADQRLVSANAFTTHLLTRHDGLHYWLLGPWERFDTLWYIHIAGNGYDLAQSVVFYPLYPTLMRCVYPFTRDMLLSAVALSTLSMFAFLQGLYLLGKLDFTRQEAVRAIMMAAAWPASFVMFGGYPEPLLLAFIVWSVYFARTGTWKLAALCGFGAAATKALGVLVVVPLAVIALQTRDKRSWPIWFVPAVPALIVTTHTMMGGSTPSAVYEAYWGTVMSLPWTSVTKAWKLAYEGGYAHPLTLQLAVFTFAFGTSMVTHLRIEYKAFALAAALLIASKDAPVDQQQWARYALVVFPAYIAAGMTKTLFFVLLAAFILINLAMLHSFILWSSVV